MAIGPDIAIKKEINEFQNVELYNLFAGLFFLFFKWQIFYLIVFLLYNFD